MAPLRRSRSSVNDTTQRDQFVAAADEDIAKGKAKLADLEKKAGVAAADAKTRIGRRYRGHWLGNV